MKKVVYKSYEELPLMLTVPDMASVLGVSRAGTYEPAHSEGFPVLKVGTLSKDDRFLFWIEKQCGGKT